MMEETTMVQQIPEAPQMPTAVEEPMKAEQTTNEKVGFWAYFGLIALFGIPIIGWIAGIAFMFFPKRKSLKNFARATMAWVLVGIIFFVTLFLALQAAVTSLIKTQFGLEFDSFVQMVDVLGELQDGNYIAMLPYIGDELTEQIVDTVGEEYEAVVEEVLSGEYNGLLEDIQDRKFERIAEDLGKGEYDDLVELLDEETYQYVEEELNKLENGDTPQWLADFEDMIPKF